MALSSDEIALLDRMRLDLDGNYVNDEKLLRYYRGLQRVEQLGMAIPPSMRRFLVIVNWPRVVVDTIEHRQSVRSMILPGEETADPKLRAIWDANNLSAHVKMFNRDRMIFGRAFMSVGTNEDDKELPLVRVESPREMTAIVDQRREVVEVAARFYGRNNDINGLSSEAGDIMAPDPEYATLYQKDSTVWVQRRDGEWIELDRDDHKLGVVPIVMHLNRRMSGGWVGESQMTDVIPLTDSAARTLTNLQFAVEAHGVPRKFMTGVEQKDFVTANEDGTTTPTPQWEAYFDAVHMLTNPNAKIGQLDAADLQNFETAVSLYGKQAATVTGFPARYFGLQTTNPPAEGAIRADEAQLVESVEGQNEEVGMTLGWMGALALRFATGDTVSGNRVRVDWFDPATPTFAQRADAITKLASGVNPILSREGAWDELGWSEARKAKERSYFAEQHAEDPVLAKIMAEAGAGRGGNADPGAGA